ncbi:E3 ubiquitin-protein ligase herc2, partial [Tulasnella sp. 408]
TDNSSDVVEVKTKEDDSKVVVTPASSQKPNSSGTQAIVGATGLLTPALDEPSAPPADSAVPAPSPTGKTDSEKTTGDEKVEKKESDKEKASEAKEDKLAQPENLSSPSSPSPRAFPIIVADDEDENTVHKGILCDGCDMFPLVGKRYKCLETSCDDYDLCENCVKLEEVHDKEHKFLVIETPRQGAGFGRIILGKDNRIILGLKVYTHKSSPAKVTTQLRHDKLMA